MMRGGIAVCVCLGALYGRVARAQVATVDAVNDGLQVKILGENLQHSFQFAQQLEQLRQALTVAKDNLALVRSVYGGISDFQNFSANTFLADGKAYFLAQNPVLTDTMGFGRDVASNGFKGRFDAAIINERLDVYGDAGRRKEEAQVSRPSYDAKAALTASRELNAAVSDPAVQKKAMGSPEPSTVSDGLFDADAARTDPQLLSLYIHQRATAREQAQKAIALYLESLGASPGKAQQLAATSMAMSAAQLAALNEREAEMVALQKLKRTEEATAREQRGAESDALSGQLQLRIEQVYGQPLPGRRAPPSLEDR